MKRRPLDEKSDMVTDISIIDKRPIEDKFPTTESNSSNTSVTTEKVPRSDTTESTSSTTSTSTTTSKESTTSSSVTTTETNQSSSESPDRFEKGDEIKGYYSLSWNDGNKGPKDSNTSVFFSGWNKVKKAMDEYDPKSQPKLVGFKYFSFGGGNRKTGTLNRALVQQYIKDIPRITAAGFRGVMFDIEIVSESADVMIPAFAEAFAATKKNGLTVGITTSHSAPCKMKSKRDPAALVKAWVQDTNVDVISPQLYDNGNETEASFEPTADCADYGCTWDLYKNMHSGMKFAPSITYAKQYSGVKKHFQSMGIDCAGYFVYFENDRRLEAPLFV